jgi:hypothetical protein
MGYVANRFCGAIFKRTVGLRVLPGSLLQHLKNLMLDIIYINFGEAQAAKNVAPEQYVRFPTSVLHTWGPSTGNMDAGTTRAGNIRLLRNTRPIILHSMFADWYSKPT